MWISDFFTNWTQAVRLDTHLFSSILLSTGAPQGCVLSPLFYSLYTHDCTPAHPTNTIMKFVDNTVVIGLITRGDESNYRNEIQRLSGWCCTNNLELNTTKTKELILDFRRKHRGDPTPLWINGTRVEQVHSFNLGLQISDNISWSINTKEIRKEEQHFLRLLGRNISVWHAGSTAADKKSLQRIIRTA